MRARGVRAAPFDFNCTVLDDAGKGTFMNESDSGD
jgi:hypothetical protein